MVLEERGLWDAKDRERRERGREGRKRRTETWYLKSTVSWMLRTERDRDIKPDTDRQTENDRDVVPEEQGLWDAEDRERQR